MAGSTATPTQRLRRSLSLKGAIITLSVGVLLPVLLSTTVGIIALAVGTSTKELLIGVLMVSFTAAAAGGAVVAVILLGRRARLARLQSDLVANVSHELRTPLSAIRMYAQTLESGLLAHDPVETRKSAATIVRETEWLEATVDRILSWRTLARDRDAIDLRPAPIRGAVEDAVERFRRMLPPGEVEVTLELASTLTVEHDRDSISRVLLNLLVNAYRYTRDGKKIRVQTRDAGDQVEILVTDNGIGIPVTELLRIFDPFYRGEVAAQGRGAGAGLGLAIVRHLVHAHRGKVTVSSEVGAGSTFTVSLPVAPGGTGS
jgi:two-component system, OmpR family, phosphate regulon sensor histidine kinase PhoR